MNIHIGDIITLRTLAGHMCAEGLLIEDVSVQNYVSNFEDCLFCVHLQRQYSAHNEYVDMLGEKGAVRDVKTKKYLAALKRGKINENKLNNAYMQQKIGDNVFFGDTIQLEHIKSGKFLSVKPNLLSNVEKENINVSLIDEGNQYSWLQLMPRFKINNIGDVIMDGCTLLVKLSERPNEYIHCSDKLPKSGEVMYDVNCSLESTGWSISVFRNAIDSLNQTNLMGLQLVTIYDPETLSNLSYNSETQNTNTKSDIILRTVRNSININDLWMIESKNVMFGGPIFWKSDEIRLRNLNSGKYLCLRNKHSPIADISLSTVDSHLEAGTLFKAIEISNSGILLSENKPTHLVHDEEFCVVRENFIDTADAFVCGGSNKKSLATGFLINKYPTPISALTSGDEINTKASLNEHVGLAARYFFTKYLNDVCISEENLSKSSIIPDSNNNFSATFSRIILKLIAFVSDPNTDVRTSRQTVVFTLGILNILSKIIEKFIPISSRAELIRLFANSVTKEEKLAIKIGSSIVHDCLKFYYHAIYGNVFIQLQTAGNLLVFFSHFAMQEYAEKILLHILATNKEFQETKLAVREMNIFIEKLRGSKMNIKYLHLLTACCSCLGAGVGDHQGSISKLFFQNREDIVIQIHANYSKVTPLTWSCNRQLFLPSNNDSEFLIIGRDTFTKGIPELTISWTSSLKEFGSLGLFGKMAVNILELYEPKKYDANLEKSRENINISDNKRLFALARKQSVADYFISELLLVAEMCLDRNYIAIENVQKLFSFDILFCLLKMNVHNNLKSAAVNLIIQLFVDLDPQVVIDVPRLTRTWSQIIDEGNTPRIPSVSVERKCVFALLQEMLWEHMNEMHNVKWKSLSKYLMILLSKLIMFNFYHTEERIKSIINPLIKAVDRRHLDFEIETKPLQSSLSVSSIDVNSNKSFTDTIAEPDLEADYDKKENDVLPSKISHSLKCFQIAASLISMNLNSSVSKETKMWILPTRYSETSILEIQTMVIAIDNLEYIQRIIEDRNLSLLLHAFYEWESGSDIRAPSEIFDKVYEDSKELTLGVDNFDDILIDLIMYSNGALTQSCLNVLMSHHTSKLVLLKNFENVQIIHSPDMEEKYRDIRTMLIKLESFAERHELWGRLQSGEDIEINNETHDILQKLYIACRIPSKILEFGEKFQPVLEIQKLLKNLGFMEIAFKIFGLLSGKQILSREESDQITANTFSIIYKCSQILYFFFLNNPENQKLGFIELNYFLDSLDYGILSHNNISAIFRNNRDLMNACPLDLIDKFAEKICRLGQKSHYLTLFSCITHVRGDNLLENQFEIVKQLMAPGRLQKMSKFFSGRGHVDYEVRVELMRPFMTAIDVDIDDLPGELAYHVEILKVLSSCCAGRYVSTIEAKIQSLYNYEDILDALLDSRTIYIVKINLGFLLLGAVIDVDMMIGSLTQSPKLWQLFSLYANIVDETLNDFEIIDSDGWFASGISQHKIEYMIICVMVLSKFLSKYFDTTYFSLDQINNEVTLDEVIKILKKSYKSIQCLKFLNPVVLSEGQKSYVSTCLALIEKHLHSFDSESTKFAKKDEESNFQKQRQDHLTDCAISITERKQQFIAELAKNENFQLSISSENYLFLEKLESLPKINSNEISDVRYESFIRRLVSYISSLIKVTDDEKIIDLACANTTSWVIVCFRGLIEHKWGMSIFERDDGGGEDEDIAAAEVMAALNTCGATKLCLDLISIGIENSLVLECVKLCVGLLFREGGSIDVQNTINLYLTTINSTLFFKQLSETILKLVEWHKRYVYKAVAKDENPELPNEIIFIRFMQLMCEGHFKNNQDLLREQNNSNSINLLDDLVLYLNFLSRNQCRTSTTAALRVCATILEVLQGPCEKNQTYFSLDTELIEVLNRILRSKIVLDCIMDEEIELKKTAIDIFQGLLEGQGRKSVVYDRVLSVIHIDVIQSICTASGSDVFSKHEDFVSLRTECLVLIEMLCAYKPSLKQEIRLGSNSSAAVSGIGSVEILWRGELQRRFFHISDICDSLSKASKDKLVETVDRSNQENKLQSFISKCNELFREVKHQELLKNAEVDRFFTRNVEDIVSWISFLLAICINILFAACYNVTSGVPQLDQSVDFAVRILHILLFISSICNLIISIVLRIPLRYQKLLSLGHSDLYCFLNAIFESRILYNIIFLACVILGYVWSDFFISILLLDIISKNAIAANIFNAVLYPINQIGWGLLLTSFICYEYALIYFLNFRPAFQNSFFPTACDNLFHCTMMSFGNSLRTPGGIQNFFNMTLGWRMVVDNSYFVIVSIILLNIIFGMIIDTFSALRKQKDEKYFDTTKICFVCGIEKDVFDRSSLVQDGFKLHIANDHNMWSYMNFMFYLWEQDRDDDDGLETFVRKSIISKDISWFPVNKAICLKNIGNSGDVLPEMKDCISSSENNLLTKIFLLQNVLNTNVNNVLKTVSTEINNESSEVELFSDHKKIAYRISISILECTGLEFNDSKDHGKIFCKIQGDEDTIKVQSGFFSTEKILFETNTCLICCSAVADDNRFCRIEILYSNSSPIVIFEIGFDEIIASSGLILEKSVFPSGASKQCVLSLLSISSFI